MRPIVLNVHNSFDFERLNEPVTVGVPFARGAVKDAALLSIRDARGAQLPGQVNVQCRWGDGSVQ